MYMIMLIDAQWEVIPLKHGIQDTSQIRGALTFKIGSSQLKFPLLILSSLDVCITPYICMYIYPFKSLLYTVSMLHTVKCLRVHLSCSNCTTVLHCIFLSVVKFSTFAGDFFFPDRLQGKP